MKNIKRIGILAFICILLFSIMTVGVCAAADVNPSGADVNDTTDVELNEVHGSDLDFSDRLEYALQGTVTGLLMVFAVLALLAVVVTLSKVVLYDLPRKARAAAAAEAKAEAEKEEEIMAQAVPVAAPVAAHIAQADDGELIAVITAAVAAAIESGDYGSEFASGFRVVSFNRVNTGTWNKR